MRRLAVCAFFLLGGLTAAQTSTIPELRTAAATITADHLLRHIRELSSDVYTGRFPGTPGEDEASPTSFRRSRPSDSSRPHRRADSRRRCRSTASARRARSRSRPAAEQIPLSPSADFVLWSNLPDDETDVRGAGWYLPATGLSHPNTTGTTTPAWTSPARRSSSSLAIRQSPIPANPTKLDERAFLGNALTIYGRTGTKLEIAFSMEPPQSSVVPRGAPPPTCGRTSRAKT